MFFVVFTTPNDIEPTMMAPSIRLVTDVFEDALEIAQKAQIRHDSVFVKEVYIYIYDVVFGKSYSLIESAFPPTGFVSYKARRDPETGNWQEEFAPKITTSDDYCI